MSNAKSNRKKQRAHKVSRGIHGSTGVQLSEVQKALLGGGVVAATQHVPHKSPWRGASGFDHPYDARQALENKQLYPHLFES